MAHRTWRGPQDLSARIWIGRDGDTLVIRAEVRDDVQADGDKVEAWLNKGEKRALKCMSRNADTVLYEGRFALPRNEFTVGLHVIDDDGAGVDGWLMLYDENAPRQKWML